MADPTNSRPTSPVTSAVSDENLRSWLTDALETVHGDAEYVWVESIDVDEGAVVYSTRTEDEPSTLLRRTFAFDEDTETVSLSDDPSPVRRKVTYEDAPDAPVSAASQIPKALQRVLAAFGFRVSQDGEEGEGTSDVDLRELMDRALRSTEPGYYETVEIFPDTQTVIYVSIPEDDLLWWRRTYELTDDGSGLSLNDDREQIEPVTRYQPVNASSQEKEESASAVVKSESTNDSEPDNTNVTASSTDATNDCGCTTQGDGDVTRKGTTMKDKTKVVDGLIANEASPFTEDHSEFLNSLSEDGLQDLSDRYEVADAGDAAEGADVEEEVKETKAASDTSSDGSPKADPPKADDGASSPSSTPSDSPSDDEVRLSRDEYQELSAAAKELKAQKAAEKAELVSALDAAIDDGFDKSDLEAMDIATLRKMAKAHKLDEPSHDYSGRGLASAAVANSEVAPIPKPWTNALKSRDTNREEAN